MADRGGGGAPAMVASSASPTLVTPVTSAAIPDSASARMISLFLFKNTDISDRRRRPPVCKMTCTGDNGEE